MNDKDPAVEGGTLPTIVRCKACNARHGRSFCNFSSQALDVFLRIGRSQRFEPGSLLFEIGEPSRGVFILCEGELKVTRRERGLSVSWTAHPGDVLGLHETMSHQPYRSRAESLVEARLRFIPTERFQEFLEDEIDASIWTVHFL